MFSLNDTTPAPAYTGKILAGVRYDGGALRRKER
jgi:hypothetical protein